LSAPAAAVFLQLYGGLPNLMAVRQWVKAQIMQQCQGSLPRLKPDLPPQVRTAAQAAPFCCAALFTLLVELSGGHICCRTRCQL
jgi:hypothetical protein